MGCEAGVVEFADEGEGIEFSGGVGLGSVEEVEAGTFEVNTFLKARKGTGAKGVYLGANLLGEALGEGEGSSVCGVEFFVALGVDGFDGIVEEFGIKTEVNVEVLAFAFNIADGAEYVAKVVNEVRFEEFGSSGGEGGGGQAFGVLKEGLHFVPCTAG